ncbi:hypothetical protein N7494_008718 [Penicillium frequentans]|uniref:Uncharacterized protein n=1 Tax=Penicillium frequentans TaxID=3151616 RepID=A0AAD6CNE8_9EURO|nr:hypothetical protein N7494_008718 [Penicillium glabrum]
MLVLSVQLLKLGTLEDIFDDLHEVDSKDLERFFEMEALGQFYLRLEGSRDCHANLFLPNKKRLAQLQTTVRAVPNLIRSQLERKAVIRLVSKLKESDLWRKSIVPAANVSVDDELIFTMQEARDDLLQADQIFAKESSQLTDRFAQEDSSNAPTTIQVEIRSQKLKQSLDERRQSEDPGTIEIRSQQDQLPVIQIRQQVLEIINGHTYSIIAAETGSGKSTQIPQIILDDAIDQGFGGQCNVICVQPRRIAAQLLAERVSHERGEVVGDSVGCLARYDYRRPTNIGGNITYCTTGIMLNILQNQPETLSSLTHIMLDEVHVRDIGIDLIMMLLKRYVDKCRSTGVAVPRIVILSATIDLDLFSTYFANIEPDGKLIPAPYISIPGRQFDVKKHNLDNVLDELAATYEPDVLSSLLDGPETKSFLDNHYARFEGIVKPEIEASNSVTENPTGSSTNLISAVQTSEALEMEDRLIPYGVIAALIFHLLNTTTSGSILVFLPGLATIKELEERTLAFTAMKKFDLNFTDEGQFRLFKLHAALPAEMAKLSLPFPEGCRRVFLSTDVAEASVTIPDVKYVIDTGKVNNLVYDHTARSRRLGSFWVSKASAIQRAGRAGRVQDGEYFFLGTQQCYDNLRKMKSPDIQRAPLDELCLRVKANAPDTPIIDVLKQTLEPPNTEAVMQTIKHLTQTRLLDENENLTNLGALLDHLPLDPSAGRLVILGVIFQCLEPMLILAALNGESLFRRPSSMEDSHTIRNKRHEFAGQSHCDHISTINAFKAMRAVERHGLSVRDYAQDQHLEFHSYTEATSVVNVLLESLKAARLVRGSPIPKTSYHVGGNALNINSDCIPLIKALILHAQFPHVAAPTPSTSRSYFSKTEREHHLPWASAANILPPPPIRDLVTYQGKQASHTAGETSMLRENSLVSPLAMCLFGGRMVWKDRMLRMDSWLPLGINMKDPTYTSDEAARSIIELHKAIDKVSRSATIPYMGHVPANLSILTQCLKSAYASLNHEKQPRKFYLARNKLFRSLQKAVRATLECDNHRYAVPSQGNWSEHDAHDMKFDKDQSNQEEITSKADEEELQGP